MKHWWFKFGLVLLACCSWLAACQENQSPSTQQPQTLLSKPAPSQHTSLILHHQLKVIPDIITGHLQVEDQLRPNKTLTEGIEIALNATFTLALNQQVQTPTHSENGLNFYQLPAQTQWSLSYSGKLQSTPQCDWLVQACVMFNKQGIYLDPNSHWYVDSLKAQHTFELATQLPDNWVSLSQGLQRGATWTEILPQDSIYLVAGPFKVYREVGQHATAMVYLLQEDADLAKRYLAATHTYLNDYSQLLGDYPYAKFATVEGFWETGWGMPSFTILGSRVLRLPFILHSSFPHEIVHNWWGNGVYVDPSFGNWSEGLTAYLSDYRLKEYKGEGMEYRRDTVQNYAAFTQAGQDFPLKDFRSRHNQTTQAVGYSKSLMLFHALRQQVGSDSFFLALRTFYRNYRFKNASFMDLRNTFESVSGQDLRSFFEQWLQRTGAPRLTLTQASADTKTNHTTQVRLSIAQTPADTPWQLKVPLIASFAEQPDETRWVTMNSAEKTVEETYTERPLNVAVDPHFDLLRIPDPTEVPPALNVLYNQEPKTFVLSRQVPAGMELVWDELAESFTNGPANMRIQYDDEPMPTSGTVVLLGGDNAGLTDLLMRANQPFKLTETAYTLNSVSYTCGLHSLALTLYAGQQQLILLDASTPETLNQLMQKLRHYGKYSYVLFNSATGENVAKGQWEITDSPLNFILPAEQVDATDNEEAVLMMQPPAEQEPGQSGLKAVAKWRKLS